MKKEYNKSKELISVQKLLSPNHTLNVHGCHLWRHAIKNSSLFIVLGRKTLQSMKTLNLIWKKLKKFAKS